MRFLRLPRWLPLAILGSCLLAPAFAACLTSAAAAADPSDARAWLAWIHGAAAQRNYQGTLVVSAGGVVSSSSIAHFCAGDQTYERQEALDGRMQRVYRHNDLQHTFWPQDQIVVVERRESAPRARPGGVAAEPRALDQYELKAEGRERVAGRDAQVVLLKPRDEMRYAQRLWADRATGLLLRADILGPQRSVLESTAFSAVEIGVRAQPDSVLGPMKRIDGYRVVRAKPQSTRLEDEGWSLARAVPPGFELASCVKRPLASGAAPGSSAPAPAQVVHAVFSDGLAHVSIFIEPYESRRHKTGVEGQIGATGTLMQRRGDHWLTAMGDVPPATLKWFVDALERRP